MVREMRKMTPHELADASGISTEVLGLIERGEISPSIPMLVNLTQTLEIEPSCIVEDTAQPATPELFDVIERIKRAPPKLTAVVADMLELLAPGQAP
nr:helix-turn-helix transcriptional regulator [Haliangium ochraceum]